MALPLRSPEQFDSEAPARTEERLRRHRRGVWRFLRFLGAEPELADDLTQETFVRLLSQPFEDRGDAALRTWLQHTAHNLFRSTGRQMRRDIATLDPRELEHAWSRLTERDASVDLHLQILDRCLEELDARSRSVLTLRHGERLDRARIAKQLGMSVEGVKSLLRRAKERLRVCLRRRLEEV